MSLWDTLLVNGTDLISMGCVAAPYEFPYNSAPQRGDLSKFNGVDGVRYSDQPYDAGLLSVTVSLSPSCSGVSVNSWVGLNDAYRALRLLCKPDRPSVLTRRMGFTSGDESHTANAKLLDIVTVRPVSNVLKCLIEFTLTDGCWFGPTQTIAAFASSSPTIKGDVRTLRITATLSAGAVNPVVTNNENLYSFSYTGTVPAGGVAVDVLNRRAKRLSDNVDVSLNLKWAKQQIFRLEPGANAISTTSGTVALTYDPAYL